MPILVFFVFGILCLRISRWIESNIESKMNQMDRILVARQFLLLLRDFKREAWTCKTRYWNTRNSYRGRETLIEDNQWPHVHRCVSMRFNRYAIFPDDEQGLYFRPFSLVDRKIFLDQFHFSYSIRDGKYK